MKYLPIVVCLLLFSCSKEVKVLEAVDSNEKHAKMTSFMKAGVQMDYRNDFKVSILAENVPPRTSPSNMEIFLIQKASADPSIMLQEYSNVKAQLLDLFEDNDNDRYTWAIQNTALKYLRRLFLVDNSDNVLPEIELLLDMLIVTKSVDLDILGEAFDRSKEHLENEKRNVYYSYIKALHDNELKFVKENATKYQNLYEKAEGKDKYKYLAFGKDLERRSLACFHTRELLEFNSNY